MEVVALKKGYYGGMIREAGDKFEYHGEVLPKWVQALEAKEPPAAKPVEKRTSKKSDVHREPVADETPAPEVSDESLM